MSDRLKCPEIQKFNLCEWTIQPLTDLAALLPLKTHPDWRLPHSATQRLECKTGSIVLKMKNSKHTWIGRFHTQRLERKTGSNVLKQSSRARINLTADWLLAPSSDVTGNVA